MFYVLFKLGLNFWEVSWWTLTGFAFLSLVNYVTYTNIIKSLELGVGYEYYLDFFAINMSVQFLSVFSDYFWLLYLSVPGYLGYYVFKYLLAWANSSGAPEEEEEEPSKKKKEKRPKVKYIKR